MNLWKYGWFRVDSCIARIAIYVCVLGMVPAYSQSSPESVPHLDGGCDAILKGIYNYNTTIEEEQYEEYLRLLIENDFDTSTLSKEAISARVGVPIDGVNVQASGNKEETFQNKLKESYKYDQDIVKKNYIKKYFKSKTVSEVVVKAWSDCMNNQADELWIVEVNGEKGKYDVTGLFSFKLTYLPKNSAQLAIKPKIKSMYISPGLTIQGDERLKVGTEFIAGEDRAISQPFIRSQSVRELIDIQFDQGDPVVFVLPATPPVPLAVCDNAVVANVYESSIITSGSQYGNISLAENGVVSPCGDVGEFRENGEFVVKREGLYSIKAEGRFGVQEAIKVGTGVFDHPEYNLAINRKSGDDVTIPAHASDRCSTNKNEPDICIVNPGKSGLYLRENDIIWLSARTDLADNNKVLNARFTVDLLVRSPEPEWPIPNMRLRVNDDDPFTRDLQLTFDSSSMHYEQPVVSGDASAVSATIEGDILTITPKQAGRATVRFVASNTAGEKTVSFDVDVIGDTSIPSLAANFTAEPLSDGALGTVRFTDASSGDITSRKWDFGDGNTSTDPHPIHTFANAGTYTVTLTVSGSGGEDTTTKTIAVQGETLPLSGATLTVASRSASSGQSISLPIFLKEVEGAGLRFEILYDTALLDLIDARLVSSGNSLFSSSIINKNNPGRIIFILTNAVDISLTDEVAIAEIVLEISPDAPLGGVTLLGLQEVELLDADNAAIPISTVDGILTFEEDFLIGDTNENGLRDLGDAIKLMRFLAELEIFTDRQQQAADLNGNGIPDLGDLIKLLRVLAELETLEKPVVDTSSFARPRLEGAFGQGKGSDTVEWTLSGRDWPVGAAELLLRYDTDQLLWVGYEPPVDDTPHALTVVNGNRPGAVRLLRAHLADADGAVDIGRLRFRRLDDAAPAIEVASFSYVDLSGRLRPTDKDIHLPSSPSPESITLYPNLPNPFNPETTIRFAMPATGAVRLAIFDLMGQEIRTLAEGIQPAGQHSAIWDGCDDAGRAVSSGVYFYRLSNESGRYLAGKMLLLR